jgi:hypothetical protein
MRLWFDERFGYLRFVDNWHKHPIVSRIMCKMGRHDFELRELRNGSAVLECFYCGRLRESFLSWDKPS